MKSFLLLFCESARCPESEFARRVFWRCLPPHAVPVAFLLGGWRGDYFSLDRELIQAAGRAANLRQVREEITDYFLQRENARWLRRRGLVRVSTSRLQKLAKRHFSEEGAHAVGVQPRPI